jgi:hypothetical protein
MANIQAVPFMRGINHYVPNMQYASNVDTTGAVEAHLGAPIALDADGILDNQSIAAASNTSTFASTYTDTVMGVYGRNVTVVASGAATSTVTIRGFDYLGQPMSETLTLNGSTPVLGVKMFRHVSNVAFGATAATTIDVGWGSRLGLPYRAVNAVLSKELVSGAAPTAGAIVAGPLVSTAATATSVDARGHYTPQASFLPDGVRVYQIAYFADNVNGLHGHAQFA